MNYFFYLPSGEITQTLSCNPSDLDRNLKPGKTCAEGHASFDDYFDIENSSVKPKGQSPSLHHTFNYTTKQWEDPRSLQDLKDAQWAIIKQARTQAEHSGFTWDGSTFDSDAISQQRITGAVTLAQLSIDFTINWTLQNNTVRTLNQMDMLNVGVALGLHVAVQFSKAQTLRTQIEAATTPAEVAAVVW